MPWQDDVRVDEVAADAPGEADVRVRKDLVEEDRFFDVDTGGLVRFDLQLLADGSHFRIQRRFGHKLHRGFGKPTAWLPEPDFPALLGAVGVARPFGLDPRQVPGAVGLAVDPPSFLGPTHRRLTHPNVPGELAITAGAHTRGPVVKR